MLSLTPHMLYSPPWTKQPSPGMQNEQVPEVPTLLSVLTADSIQSTSSMIPCGQFITNSDDDVQLLPTRGRGEEMDEYGHDHWSLSDESNRKSCCCLFIWSVDIKLLQQKCLSTHLCSIKPHFSLHVVQQPRQRLPPCRFASIQ